MSHLLAITFRAANLELHRRHVSLPSPIALLRIFSNFSTSLLKGKFTDYIVGYLSLNTQSEMKTHNPTPPPRCNEIRDGGGRDKKPEWNLW